MVRYSDDLSDGPPPEDPAFTALLKRARRAERHQFAGAMQIRRADTVLLDSQHGCANWANVSPVLPATRFGTASLSKVFTAIATVSLALEDRLDLHQPVVDLLPEHLRPRDLHREITTHQLLTHTSGMPDYFEEDDIPESEQSAAYAALWSGRALHEIRTDLDLLPLFADLSTTREPGEYRYCNAGYVMLGILLAQVTGQPFDEVVAERVFAPAGMTTSFYPALDELHPHIAVGHLASLRPGGPLRSNIYAVPPVGGGDGGAFTTAGDLTVLLRALDSDEAWGSELPALIRTRHVDLGEGWSQGYGVEIGPGDKYGKDGGDPGVCTFARYWPDSGLSAVFLANVDSDTVPELDEILEEFIDTTNAYAHPRPSPAGVED